MPIIKSAKKALKQNKKRRVRNIKKKKNIRETLKQIKSLVAENKIKEAKMLLPQIYKLLDKASKTKLIKKKTGSRSKSRITKMINREGKKN